MSKDKDEPRRAPTVENYKALMPDILKELAEWCAGDPAKMEMVRYHERLFQNTLKAYEYTGDPGKTPKQREEALRADKVHQAMVAKSLQDWLTDDYDPDKLWAEYEKRKPRREEALLEAFKNMPPITQTRQ